MDTASTTMCEFCDALESAVQKRDPGMEVKLGRAQSGEFVVTIQNASHSEQYVVNLRKGDWACLYAIL